MDYRDKRELQKNKTRKRGTRELLNEEEKRVEGEFLEAWHHPS